MAGGVFHANVFVSDVHKLGIASSSIPVSSTNKTNCHSNMNSFFRFVNKRASYPFGIISLAHAPVNVTDFSIGSINCVRHFPQK